MTASTEVTPATATPIPLGLRVASTLCWVVGVLSLLVALAISIPLLTSAPRTWIPLLVNGAAATLVCVAAVLVRQRRKLGAYFVVVAWALPTVVNLLAGAGVRAPSLFMTLALITLAANWRELR